MAEQVTFEDWFNQNCEGLNGEARRLMQMSWNAALSNGDLHFFIHDLSDALPDEYSPVGASWNELLLEVRRMSVDLS